MNNAEYIQNDNYCITDHDNHDISISNVNQKKVLMKGKFFLYYKYKNTNIKYIHLNFK